MPQAEFWTGANGISIGKFPRNHRPQSRRTTALVTCAQDS